MSVPHVRGTPPVEQKAEQAEDVELREWLDSLDFVLQERGRERAEQILGRLREHASQAGVRLPFTANTPYINTIPAEEQAPYPGNQEIERRIKSFARWNALAMVVRANRLESGIGGHISTYGSAATLYEVGFNHFFRARGENSEGDIIYFPKRARFCRFLYPTIIASLTARTRRAFCAGWPKHWNNLRCSSSVHEFGIAT